MDIIIPLEDVLITQEVQTRYLLFADKMGAEFARKGIRNFSDETFRLKANGSGEIFVADPKGKVLAAMPVAKGEFTIKRYPMSN